MLRFYDPTRGTVRIGGIDVREIAPDGTMQDVLLSDTSGPLRHATYTARQARLVAVVMVATMLIWMALQWVGGQLGWPSRWVFLFDLAALAAFVWSLVVTVGIWRARRRTRM